jgi:uncharacterized membrane protein
MTKVELDEIRVSESKNKMRSRTLWITIAWMSFVPLSIIAQILLADMDIQIPTAQVVMFAGTISSLFVAGDKGLKAVETMKLDVKK